MQPYRSQDLRSLTQPPRTAAEVCAEAFANPPAPMDVRLAEIAVKLRLANPDAVAADIDDAARTLLNFNLSSALADKFTGYRAQVILQRYASVVLAHAAPEKAVAA